MGLKQQHSDLVPESGAGALSHFVLAAARLAEVSHRRQLGVDGATSKPTVVQIFDCLLCVLLSAELQVGSGSNYMSVQLMKRTVSGSLESFKF